MPSESVPPESESGSGYRWKTWLKQNVPVLSLDFNMNAPKIGGKKGKTGKSKSSKEKQTDTNAKKGEGKTKEKGKEAGKNKSAKKDKKKTKGEGNVMGSDEEKGLDENEGEEKGAEKRKKKKKSETGAESGTEGEGDNEEKGDEDETKKEKKKGERQKNEEEEEIDREDETGTETETDAEGKKDKKKPKKKGGKKGKAKGATDETGTEADTGAEGKKNKKKSKKKGGKKGKAEVATDETGTETETDAERKKGKASAKTDAAGSKSESDEDLKKKVKFDEDQPKNSIDTRSHRVNNPSEEKNSVHQGKKGERKREPSRESFETVSSTGGPVIEHLNLFKPESTPRFYMEEGSVDLSTITNDSDESQKNITSSSSAFSSERRGKSELGEIIELHKKMLEMQAKNYELTHSVAKAGEQTAESVNLLLRSLPLIPSERVGLSKAPVDHNRGRRDGGAGGKPIEPRHVHVRLKFLRMSDIDTVGQNFEAEVYIEARWTEKKYHGYSMAKLAKIDFKDCWDPQLKIINVVGKLDMDQASMVLRNEPYSVSPVLVYMWHVKGVFKERMELEHFPFDVQELGVVISSELPLDHVDLIEEQIFDSCVILGALQLCHLITATCERGPIAQHVSKLNGAAVPHDLVVTISHAEESEEWDCYRHVEFVHDVMKREILGSYKHPVLVISAHAKRKLGSYFWNVGLIVILTLALTFTLFSIEPRDPERLNIILLLYLTAVTFKLVVKASLPNISYLTYLDIYVMFSLVYLCLHAAETAMMLHLVRFRDTLLVQSYDEIGQACLIVLLIFFHLAFLIFIELTVLNRRRHMVKLDQDFQQKQLKRAKARQVMKNSMVS